MMDPEQLASLIERAQRRDTAALDEIVQAYAPRLFGYFYRLARPEAEDLLQELFLRMVRMIGTYQHDGRFDAWLFRIAANLVRDRVRRARRGTEGDVSGAEALYQMPADSAELPDEQVSVDEQCDRLQQAIEQLPPTEREVIMLRHFSQLSFQEIADMMQTPLGTALARAHRGLRHLRELMESGEQ